jgi:hypothetical protein
MKLRILEQTVRFRLKRSEVDRLAAEGFLHASIRLGESGLDYRIESSPADAATLRWDGAVLTVVVPSHAIQQWAASDDVGWYAEIGGVSVVIEKDFQRTHVRGEFDFDLYPNPRRAGSAPV